MIYLTEEEATQRLESSENLINSLQIKTLNNGGKHKGTPNFSDMERVLAGSLAHLSGGKATAAAIGMTPQQVSNIKTGKSGGDKIQDGIDHTLGIIKDRALNRVAAALNLITDEKMEEIKPREAAAIAKDMAAVYEKVSDKSQQALGLGLQVIVYTPQQHKDASVYDVIEVETK